MLGHWSKKKISPVRFASPHGADVSAAIVARRKFFAECQCCFCGEAIDDAVGVELIIAYEDDSKQQFWAHAACLKSRAHSSAAGYVDDQPKISSTDKGADDNSGEEAQNG